MPLYEYHQTPTTYEEKLHNVNLAFNFLEEMDIKRHNQPSEIVRGELRALMKIIYALFMKFNLAVPKSWDPKLAE